MMRIFRLIIVAVFPLFLCGCLPSFDNEQARICRTILPVLHNGTAILDIASVSANPVIGGKEHKGVRIDYLSKLPGERYVARFAMCFFQESGVSAQKSELIAVLTESGPLSNATVVFLQRYYLEDSESASLVPGPGTAELSRLPVIEPWLATGFQHFFALLPLTGIYALLAASYALVYGLIGRINLAFGAFATLGGLCGGLVLIAAQKFGAGSLVIILFIGGVGAIMTAASWGEWLANSVLGPLVRHEHGSRAAGLSGQPVLIATAGLLIAMPEMMQIAQSKFWLAPVMSSSIPVARSDGFLVTLTPLSIMIFLGSLIIGVVLLLLMKFSRFGRNWRACSDDPLTASLFGISQEKVLAVTVLIACALAGFVGYVFSLQYGNIGYSDGKLLGLKALVAAVAGGIGSLPGAMMGGICLGVLEAVWSANLPIEYRDVAIFSALVFLLALRPGGFFGLGDMMPRRV